MWYLYDYHYDYGKVGVIIYNSVLLNSLFWLIQFYKSDSKSAKF